MAKKILIAEDDRDIAELLRLYLENAGYSVRSAGDGGEALTAFLEEKPDLMIVDVMMPVMNGFELVRRIRERSDIPVIFLSAMGSDSDRIMGLDLGADDYVSKPFNPLEVAARVKANLRRCEKARSRAASADEEEVLISGALRLEPAGFRLTKNGSEIQLTLTEFRILTMLMRSPGRVFTREQIFSMLNADEVYRSEADDQSIMVHISNLRDKIEDDPRRPEYLKTVRGLGYKIEKQQTV